MPRATKTGERPPYYGRNASESLHILREHWGKQKQFLGEQCRSLLEQLPLAIENTAKASPLRSAPFNPDGSGRKRTSLDRMSEKQVERRLEHKIWDRWRISASVGGVPGLWTSLVGIQVPLFNSKLKDGWGSINLLGLDPAGAPVVVELKKGESKEIPLRPVLEAVSYAVAIRENWGTFSKQLAEQLKGPTAYSPCSAEAAFPCVVLAPIAYWRRWRLDKAVTAESWQAFDQLIEALALRGYPVSFGLVDDSASPLTAAVVDFPDR